MAIEHISDFTASAGTDLTAITPPVGSAWLLGSSGTSEVMLSNGSAIYRSAAGGINVFYAPDLAAADDFDIAFRFDVRSQDSNWFHVLADVNSAGTTFYSIEWHYDTDNVWACNRVSGGTPAALSGTYAAAYSNGDTIAGRITRRTESGSTKLRLYLDGVLVITWTDSSPLTATRRAGHRTDSGMTSTTGLQLSGFAVMNPGEADFSISPTTVTASSSGNTLTLSGSDTPWDAIRAGFSVSAGTITGTTYNANDDVDLTYTAPATNQTVTVTCRATGSTATFDITGGATPPDPLPSTFGDLLVSDEYIESRSGTTRIIGNVGNGGVVKLAENPVWPTGAAGTVDRDIFYPFIVKRLGVNDFRMVAAVADAGGVVRTCYYTTEGERGLWARPNLGLYGSNNVVIPESDYTTPLDDYDGSPEGRTYVMAMSGPPTTEFGVYQPSIAILCSSDLIHWTLGKVVRDQAGRDATEFQESKGQCILRSDGKYITFYSQGHFEVSPLRQIGAYLSDTSDLTGTWTDLGILITGTGTTDQRYDMAVIYRDPFTWLAVVSKFNQSTNILGPMRLYASHDEGESWTLLDANWIPLGTGSDWESAEFGPGMDLVRLGNSWDYYYTGTAALHGASSPLDEKLGVATIPYRRIAGIAPDAAATERSIVTAPIDTDAETYLLVNWDAHNGTLKVEVLDADDDTPISGYGNAASSMLALNGGNQLARWSGVETLPASSTIKLKFYLTDTTLYSYELSSSRPFVHLPNRINWAGMW